MDKVGIRAANITILKEVWKAMKTKDVSLEAFYKEIGLAESTVYQITGCNDTIAKKWDYKKIANKFNMDYKVFNGEYLIKIDSEAFRNISKEFDNIVDKRVKNKFRADNLKKRKTTYSSEEFIWEMILENRDIKKSNPWREIKKQVLYEIEKQTEEEDFNDVQLWRFWNYIRKKV